MTEEIQEVERLIRQSGELADSLIRLAQKLREQHQCFLNTVQQPGLQDVTLFQFEPDECGKNQLVADYLQLGRDYFIAPRPNYHKFTYPHPLRRHSIR
jgi:hypothetical protein